MTHMNDKDPAIRGAFNTIHPPSEHAMGELRRLKSVSYTHLTLPTTPYV